MLRSEDHILSCINKFFSREHERMPLGRGDDCAVMATPQEICVSTDLFLEDVHFRRSYFTPEEIGHKALAVNISDIAAMGAKPLALSMGLMLPKDMDRDELERMMAGMAALASRYHVALTGGDISRATSLGFSITIYGEAQAWGEAQGLGATQAKGKFLQRGQCHEGDIVFSIGALGLARVGLLSLEDMGRAACELYPTACQAHLMPQPLVEAGTALALNFENLSLMDLSDGLARDVPRLLGCGAGRALGADLVITPDMLHADIMAFAEQELMKEMPTMLTSHVTPDATAGLTSHAIMDRAIHHAFMGGEDYALLGTCSSEDFAEMNKYLEALGNISTVHRLGVVTSGPLRLNGHTVEQSGFDHFSS